MTHRKISYIVYRWSIFPVFVLFMWLALSYLIDCGRRAGSHSWYSDYSPGGADAYVARYSYTGRNWVLLRLYREGSDRVLAERLFRNNDVVKLHWTSADLYYSEPEDDSFHDGVIALQPTKWDRALTHLP